MRVVIDEFDFHAIQKAFGLEPTGSRWRKVPVEVPAKKISPWKGKKHTEEVKKILSELKKGTVAWNRGLPNLVAKKRMKKHNPMKDPTTAQKVAEMLRGRSAHNRIEVTYMKVCKECGKEEEKRDTKHNRANVFCGKSCAARWFNMNRREY